jgi:putative hemolysin
MHDELARSTQRLMQMLRPAPAGIIRPIQRFPDFPATLGRLGALEVRLAQEKRDVKRAQKLRYRVFY